MTISLFANRWNHRHQEGDTASPAKGGGAHAKRRGHDSPSALSGHPRFEKLRSVLPRTVAKSLLRLAPLPSAKGRVAEAADRPVDHGGIGDDLAAQAASLFDNTEYVLLSRAMKAEAEADEQTSRAVIEVILDVCEAGNAVFDDDLARITFRLIASLQEPPRDCLLDRALEIACNDSQLNVPPQALTSNKWLVDERVKIYEHMHTAVMAMPDTPERAAHLGIVISWINRFLPSDQPAAIKKALSAIEDTDVTNRFEPLTQLQNVANETYSGPESGYLLTELQNLGGRWLPACRTSGDWDAMFPRYQVVFPELVDA